MFEPRREQARSPREFTPATDPRNGPARTSRPKKSENKQGADRRLKAPAELAPAELAAWTSLAVLGVLGVLEVLEVPRVSASLSLESGVASRREMAW